jgi:uncharacterized membrane protein YkvA (DUF1232 family)
MHRLLRFRNELVTLWRAFRTPGVPLYLKALMLVIPAYLLMPFDIIPDFIPVVGYLDDIIIIPLLVSLIVTLLPKPAPVYATARSRNENGPTIDGDYRQL